MVGSEALIPDMLALDVATADDPGTVSRARAGDDAAFGELVAEHEPAVLRTAWRLLGNAEDARDIAQEAFLRLHRHLGRLDPERAIGPWLYRVTVNLSLTALRRRKRRPESPLENAGRSAAVGTEKLEQERRGDAADARRVLASVLDRLSDRERVAVILRDLEGMDVHDVARALGCRRVTVRSYLSRGRLKLRQAVKSVGGPS
jgi:RNA polymerase sigma-70 factor (ECF subfamily)